MQEQGTPSPERAGRHGRADGQGESAGVGAQERALQALAGASDPREAVEAVESLRASLWQGMLAAVRDPSAADVAALADRVAGLCSTLLSASLRAPDGAPARPQDAGAGGTEPLGDAAPVPPRTGWQDLGRPGYAPAPPGPGVIVDEREREVGIPASVPPPLGAASRAHARHASTVVGGEIAVHDERAGQAAPWIAAIARRVREFERDHRPFAVLLIELGELDRLRAALTPHELERLSADVAQVIAELLAGEGEAPIAQGPGRYWLIARAMDAADARELARRIAAAVPGRVAAAGSLLVGIAVCPVNARSAAGLAAHADVDLYAARGPLAARA